MIIILGAICTGFIFALVIGVAYGCYSKDFAEKVMDKYYSGGKKECP